jgi:hypothetical protein
MLNYIHLDVLDSFRCAWRIEEILANGIRGYTDKTRLRGFKK